MDLSPVTLSLLLALGRLQDLGVLRVFLSPPTQWVWQVFPCVVTVTRLSHNKFYNVAQQVNCSTPVLGVPCNTC